MGTVAKIARRSFLIGSVAIAGGVAFGYHAIRPPHKNPLLGTLSDGEASFNPWVKISSKSITLIAPHTDLGQGARSMQAALIAEEMDLALDQFEVLSGPPSAAYYNTASVNDLVPFMHRDESKDAQQARAVFGSIVKLTGLQITGGSSAVADSFEKLRYAGAVARETLKQAAATLTNAPLKDLKTQDGAVVLPDGTRLPYTELAALAAQIKPVQEVSLRPPSAWRLIGKPMKRLDIVAKSTGTLPFGIDLQMEGMVHATVRLNPHQGAPMLSYDARDALNMRGVQKVLEVSNGIAVIADNSWRAFKAAQAVQCDWAETNFPADMAMHWENLQSSFIEDRLDKEWLNQGDVPAALTNNGVVETVYRAPYVAHQPLEPIGAMMLVTDQRADIWVAHQMPSLAVNLVAEITGLKNKDIHLHNQYVGGSFGHRLEFENIRYAAEIANQMRGTPIKLTYRREEDFAHDYPRHIGMCRASGAVKDGKIEAMDVQVASPSVITSQFGRINMAAPGPDNQIPAGVWTAPYAIPNWRVRAYRVPEEEVAPTSSWRSVGASTGGFYIESFMDELCAASGADPLAERLRLCNYDIARHVLETVGEMSDWGSDLGPDRGRGLALVISFGTAVAEVVEVTNTPRGIQIDKVFVAADVGTIVDPVNFENNVQGGVIWGLGHAMNCEITYSDGMADQTNFHAHEGMRLYQCPEIIVKGLENSPRISGIGEPPVPPAAPALANAIFDATGIRLREMPFHKFIDFV